MPEAKRKARLTKCRIESARAEGRDCIVWDDHPSVAGFGMKATPAGKKAFKYTYRNAQARQRWLHLRCFPRLSVEAARKSLKIHHGREIEGQPHTKVGTIQRYQHYAFDRKKRAALARWETTLLAIRESQRAKVVQFPG